MPISNPENKRKPKDALFSVDEFNQKKQLAYSRRGCDSYSKVFCLIQFFECLINHIFSPQHPHQSYLIFQLIGKYDTHHSMLSYFYFHISLWRTFNVTCTMINEIDIIHHFTRVLILFKNFVCLTFSPNAINKQRFGDGVQYSAITI